MPIESPEVTELQTAEATAVKADDGRYTIWFRVPGTYTVDEDGVTADAGTVAVGRSEMVTDVHFAVTSQGGGGRRARAARSRGGGMELGAARRGLSDAEVVARVLNGDVERYAVLVERYRTAFGRYATAVCGDPDLAADAMQEAFIRAYDGLAGCREPARFGAWFFRILTNQCRNHRSRRRVHLPLEAVRAAAPERADDRVGAAEIRAAIAAALDRLVPEQREAFVLRHLDDRSYADMAQLLGEREDTLRMRVHRAREAVRQRLEGVL
jgi:RNA polymerase sigma-70 factor (ECF subfamily)